MTTPADIREAGTTMFRITITERIHHGGYRNTRQWSRELESNSLSYETFLASLVLSPYNSNRATDPNKYTRQAFDDLVRTGEGVIGWARYHASSERIA